MAKAKPTRKNDRAIGQQEMIFITDVEVRKVPGVTEHSGKSSVLSKKVDEVKNDLSKILGQLNFIVSEAEKSTAEKGFNLEEITVSLGFSASGKLAFIAEAGVEASIEVTFKRRQK